jgi:D-alanine--poly(phosphoribitol) ligase subunit 2
MIDGEKVIQAIFDAMDEINEQRPESRQLEKSADTVLFGESGLLDSLGLVNLIVAVEQRLEDDFGVSVALADEKAMSRRSSPFRTVKTLADYAASLIGEDAG